MDNKLTEAHQYVDKARQALRRGDPESARRWGEQAALLAPGLQDAWLVLAASDPDPQEALAYAQKALELRPESTRARKAVEWTLGRLKQAPAAEEAVVGPLKARAYQTAIPFPQLKSHRPNWLYPVLLLGAGCLLVGFLALFALTSPALASLVSRVSAPAPTQEDLWAPVEIARPEITPLGGDALAAQAAGTPASSAPTAALSANQQPTFTATDTLASTPTEVPTEAATVIPEVTETPGVMAMEIVADTPTSEYVSPPSGPQVAGTGNGVRWIDVDLSEQRVYAYEGDVVVNSFIVSTGTWRTPTVKGKFKVYIRLRSGNMRGPGYFLPDVPYIMYFHGDYGLHGTYWHNNFGTPMSHGCVNLSIDDAAWLYNWSYMGTVVNVHD
ncbi:MAG TPA: L,D-transpeptidase family protein [Anaerolineales bacterium]|nr:L,D-transpeptidase family protein [Anaerolineales bacterium]